LGGSVVVCPGVTIGENAVVGAGAVVTRALPPNVVPVASDRRRVAHLLPRLQVCLRLHVVGRAVGGSADTLPRMKFGFRLALVVTTLAVLVVAGPVQSASAVTSINEPSNLVCERYDNKLSVSAPRVWASYRTEQVLWTAQVQRWDGFGWVFYSTYDFWASFNSYGQNVTGWTGGWYANSTMNIPVFHAGFYRIASAVGGLQGGVTWVGYVSGGGFCQVY
jgi:hypothetical protein